MLKPTQGMRRQAWAFLAATAAAILSVAEVVRGELRWAFVLAVCAAGFWMAARLWNRQSPVPMPHFMRWILLVPRGPHSPRRLKAILKPRRGERILEIGPGIGVHALPIATSLLPGGILDALDVQPEMLEDLRRRAARAGIENIVAKHGDACALPYSDHTFDAAYLITALGEIPDEAAALRELRRVLKPSGRLVIGEVFIDPDFVLLSTLKHQAANAGMVFERTAGPTFAYFALFRPAPVPVAVDTSAVRPQSTHGNE